VVNEREQMGLAGTVHPYHVGAGPWFLRVNRTVIPSEGDFMVPAARQRARLLGI
jgi:hypothetical protein